MDIIAGIICELIIGALTFFKVIPLNLLAFWTPIMLISLHRLTEYIVDCRAIEVATIASQMHVETTLAEEVQGSVDFSTVFWIVVQIVFYIIATNWVSIPLYMVFLPTIGNLLLLAMVEVITIWLRGLVK